MTSKDQLTAYLATLGSLVVVVIGAMLIGAFSANVIGKVEAFGLGTVTGGLIGLMRIPSRSPEPIGTPGDPINTKDVA